MLCNPGFRINESMYFKNSNEDAIVKLTVLMYETDLEILFLGRVNL